MTRKHEWAECEKCPFGDQGGFVPTLNPHPQSKIAVLGEAPGAYEAVHGIPFTGPSGELLNEVLKHHEINRPDVMITNSCLCRPAKDADPPKAALNACAGRLHRELAESGVDTIIAVGKAAAYSVLDEDKATMRNMRVGPAKTYKHNPDVQVIATWHPAYCLRTPDAFPDFVKDIGKINGEVSGDWVEPEYRVYDDPVTAARVLRELGRRFRRFVIDIECGVEKDASFVHPSEYHLLCLGIAFAKKSVVVLGETAINSREVSDALREVLPRVELGAQNGKFDLAGLYNVAGKQTLGADSLLGSYCLDERPGHHSLEHQSVEVLNCPNWKFTTKKYIPKGGNYADIPRHILYWYNAIDCSNTWDLLEIQEKQFTDDDWKKYRLLLDASNALIELEMAGVPFDEEYSSQLNGQFEKELAEIRASINTLVGYEINPNSVQQVTRYYASHALILPTTEADYLTELSEKLDGEPLKFTQLLLQHRQRAKLYGTYVKGLSNRVSHGKIFTTYLLHGTTSGRLASRNPNLQNVVREKYIRNQFTATDDEHVLVQLDYKQAEGRTIAELAHDEYLANIFRDPTRDIFAELCNDIFGAGKWDKERRVAMKSIFYGDSYGRGSASITRDLNLLGVDITINEVNDFMHEFHRLTPAVRAWQASIKHRVLNGEDLITPFGRRRSFWLITDKNKKDVINEALSFLPQSIASDICLRALVSVLPELRGIATLRMTIHDALVFECHKDDFDLAVSIVKRHMLGSAKQYTNYVPFAVDVTSGFRWGEL